MVFVANRPGVDRNKNQSATAHRVLIRGIRQCALRLSVHGAQEPHIYSRLLTGG